MADGIERRSLRYERLAAHGTAGRRLLHRCRRPAVDGPRPGSRHLPQLEARRTPFAPLLRGGR